MIGRSKPKPRAKQFGADCHPPDWALGRLAHRLVSQTAVLTMGGGPLWARSERFVTGQNCVSDRRSAIRSLLTGPLPCSLPLLPISFSACFVTHFDDSGRPGTSIAGERRARDALGREGLILNESHCASPRFKWKMPESGECK